VLLLPETATIMLAVLVALVETVQLVPNKQLQWLRLTQLTMWPAFLPMVLAVILAHQVLLSRLPGFHPILLQTILIITTTSVELQWLLHMLQAQLRAVLVTTTLLMM